MLKRIGVGLTAAMLGVVALAGPASSQPEARLTLQIDPKEGKVGTPVNVQVPEDYKQECLSENEFWQAFQTLVGQIAGGFQPDVQTLLGSIGALPNTKPEDIDLTIVYALAFADIATQQPVTDETTGKQATSFWDPATGQGTIDAPNAHPRPSMYAVAAVCLDPKSPDQVKADEVLQALQGLGQSPDPEDVAQALLLPLINQEPRVAWAALFCLQGDNGEPCGAPAAGAAEAVSAEPAFTG